MPYIRRSDIKRRQGKTSSSKKLMFPNAKGPKKMHAKRRAARSR